MSSSTIEMGSFYSMFEAGFSPTAASFEWCIPDNELLVATIPFSSMIDLTAESSFSWQAAKFPSSSFTPSNR